MAELCIVPFDRLRERVVFLRWLSLSKLPVFKTLPEPLFWHLHNVGLFLRIL